MTFGKIAVFTAAILLGACGAASAATQSATGCPGGAWSTFSGLNVSISWSLVGVGPVIAFQPTRVVWGGGIAPLTPAQADAYASTLDNLRAAATARRKVIVYYDDVSKTVSTIIVRWDQPC